LKIHAYQQQQQQPKKTKDSVFVSSEDLDAIVLDATTNWSFFLSPVQSTTGSTLFIQDLNMNEVDSNGVSQQVIDRIEQFRQQWQQEAPPFAVDPHGEFLFMDMTNHQRDAEYVVECLRLFLPRDDGRIEQQATFCLANPDISDQALDVFAGFLRDETPRNLETLYLSGLQPQHFRRLLSSLYTNRSVKNLRIDCLRDHEGASWIADLLRHKTDFTAVRFHDCRLPFTQILPLLPGQPNLQSLALSYCIIDFNDPLSIQLFVDNILLTPTPTVKTLSLPTCNLSLENKPLMAGFHKNTTIIEVSVYNAATRRLFEPILRRNVYLGHVHGMLGTTSSSTVFPPANHAGHDDEEETAIVAIPTTPPPRGLWPTVMAKVGQCTHQGATPVFAILRDRLATWIDP
jgi:hypothetical protein